MLDEVRYLDRLGVGTLWVADHYAFPRRPIAPVLEAWTTLEALAAGFASEQWSATWPHGIPRC